MSNNLFQENEAHSIGAAVAMLLLTAFTLKTEPATVFHNK